MLIIKTISLLSLLFLLQNSLITCESNNNKCLYQIETRDNRTIECSGDECSKYIDIQSLIAQSATCQTLSLSLAFSTYEHFRLFRNQTKSRLSSLFASSTSNGNRYLKLYLNQLDFDDKPFQLSELIELGTNIDFYLLFIRKIDKEYEQLICDQSNDQQWNIIQIQIRCSTFKSFDKYPCWPQLIRSPIKFSFQQQQQSSTATTTTSTSTIKIHIENQSKSNQFLFYILIISATIIVLLVCLLLFIYFYLTGKCLCFNGNESELSSNSDNHNSSKFSMGSITLSETNHHRNHFDNVSMVNDEIQSTLGQQYFVPISLLSDF